MVLTGADIYGSLIKAEAKNNSGNNGLAGLTSAAGKILGMSGGKSVQNVAQGGYYNEIRSMVKQQCHQEQG